MNLLHLSELPFCRHGALTACSIGKGSFEVAVSVVAAAVCIDGAVVVGHLPIIVRKGVSHADDSAEVTATSCIEPAVFRSWHVGSTVGRRQAVVRLEAEHLTIEQIGLRLVVWVIAWHTPTCVHGDGRYGQVPSLAAEAAAAVAAVLQAQLRCHAVAGRRHLEGIAERGRAVVVGRGWGNDVDFRGGVGRLDVAHHRGREAFCLGHVRQADRRLAAVGHIAASPLVGVVRLRGVLWQCLSQTVFYGVVSVHGQHSVACRVEDDPVAVAEDDAGDEQSGYGGQDDILLHGYFTVIFLVYSWLSVSALTM